MISQVTDIYISIVYINEEWAVGDLWNSQNLPKAKQKR